MRPHNRVCRQLERRPSCSHPIQRLHEAGLRESVGEHLLDSLSRALDAPALLLSLTGSLDLSPLPLRAARPARQCGSASTPYTRIAAPALLRGSNGLQLGIGGLEGVASRRWRQRSALCTAAVRRPGGRRERGMKRGVG
eukprot:scaffold3017_cov27-Tisochrysis_lutea.AAC.5